MKRFVLLAFTLVGCAPSTPPAPPAPREAVIVQASFTKTWDAVIDVFAERNISIKTLDRTSGLIVAEPMQVGRTAGEAYADCGAVMGMAIPASAATWNILVRGDTAVTTVKATVRFLNVTTGRYGSTTECSSRGSWEQELEQRVKTAAEIKKP